MDYDKSYLESLIAKQIEESSGLDYKGAESLNRKDIKKKTEITKDVSSFANSAGGRIIYGIREYDDEARKHLPEKIDPINQREYSKEWLDQMISQIDPPIDGVTITPVHVGPLESDVCYIVDIPQSGTAHQATDLRYHKRRNFTTEAMQDYEIRDVMGRKKNPDLQVRVTISNEINGKVCVAVENTSSVIANHYLVVLDLPLKAHGVTIHPEGAVLTGDDSLSLWRLRVTPRDSVPLFPKSKRNFYIKYERSTGFVGGDPETIANIKAMVYADEMKFKTFDIDVAAAEQGWA